MGCNLKDLAPAKPIEISDLSGQRVARCFLECVPIYHIDDRRRWQALSHNDKPVSHLMGFLDRASTFSRELTQSSFSMEDLPIWKRATLNERKTRKIEAKAKWENAIIEGDMPSKEIRSTNKRHATLKW